MSNVLDALERIKENLVEFASDDYCYNDYVNDINLIEKYLCVLEIIKNKKCIFNGLQDLTQDEFELFSEVIL